MGRLLTSPASTSQISPVRTPQYKFLSSPSSHLPLWVVLPWHHGLTVLCSPCQSLGVLFCFSLLGPTLVSLYTTPVHALLAPGRPETQCHCHSLPLPSSRAPLQLPLPPPPSILLFFAVFCGLSLASASAKAPEQTTLNLVSLSKDPALPSVALSNVRSHGVEEKKRH